MGINTNILTIKKELIILGVLGLIFINFLGTAIYWCYFIIPLFAIILHRNIDLIDKSFLSILIFSCLYLIYLILNSISVPGSLLVGYLLFPAPFYFLGKYFLKKYPNINTFYFLLFFISFLFSILPFLANIRSVLENGFMTDRNIRLFWMQKGAVLSATGIGSYFAVNLALFPLLFDTHNLKHKVIVLILWLLAAFSTINMSNRTGVLIMLLVLFIFILIGDNKLWAAFYVSLFLGSIFSLYSIDAWGLRTWFNSSLYFDRLINTDIREEGSRLIIWQKSLNGLVSYPFGNIYNIIGGNYAHNLWLDIGRRAGIIPLLPLLYFTITFIVNIIRIATNKLIEESFRTLIAGAGIAFYITFSLEPIMEGFFIFFLFYCFYCGLIAGFKDFINNSYSMGKRPIKFH